MLVQETRARGFMYLGGGVRRVNWEWRLGDSMDDIAWLSLRATQEPMADSRRACTEDEELSAIRSTRHGCATTG